VYNLRGEIISVIDLRIMFHLPAEKKSEDALESLLILRIDEHVFGVIVDSIDKVVGISSEGIQPPHPIFGDINVQYIRGVVENQGRLYIILDIGRIFAPKQEKQASVITEAVSDKPVAVEEDEVVAGSELDLNFIMETLFTFKHFGVSPINEAWVAKRYEDWKALRKGRDLQLKELEEADLFLETFYSPYTGAFWKQDYAEAMSALLPKGEPKSITVWNPGCGKGHESFCFACVLREAYPKARIKIWASDADLLNISNAPNLVFDMEDVPDIYQEYLVKGKNGYSFNQAIKDLISFEYHDVVNSNPLPSVDFILCRDLLSYLSPAEQSGVLADFWEKLKPGGMMIPGKNEILPGSGEWKFVGNNAVNAFAKLG
jgi:purine-binding chemotaxis protein CheW